MAAGKHKGASTSVSRVIKAPPSTIYAAFLDADAVAMWLAPDNMTGRVHTFEPYEGGTFKISLTYQDVAESPNGKGGKSSDDTDTFEGRIAELVPDELVVWVTVFESDLCENIPPGIRPEDNEDGTRSTLQKLAKYVE